MEEQKSSKSLILYTALIFMVAILMIVVSYFSQLNQNRQINQVTGDEAENKSISEKVSELSEENMVLINTVNNLNEQNSELKEKNDELTTNFEDLSEKYDDVNLLISVQNSINLKKYKEAKENFLLIKPDNFDETQIKLYNNLKKILDKK